MRKVTALLAFFSFFCLMSCDKSSVTDDFVLTKTTTTGNTGIFGPNPDPGATRDTVTTPLYFEDRLIKSLLMGLSQNEISYVVGKHVPTSMLYIYSDVHMPTQFVPVTNDINTYPIWKEMLIEFNPGFDPHQFLSAAEIDAALHAASPEIRVSDTGLFYRYIITGK